MTDTGNEQGFTMPKTIDEALLILQADPPVLLKDQDGQVGNQKTKYADLVQANEKILSRLTGLGVLWKTKPTTMLLAGPNGSQDPRFVLDWTLLHVASGTFESGQYPLPGGANPMQNGSAITYARRYALIAVTNTVAEGMDDDGQGYRGRGGTMAQRATPVRQPAGEQQPTAQRAPAPQSKERARPVQQPDLPSAAGGLQGPPTGADPAANAPAEPHRGRGGLITEPMVRKLVMCVKDAGITGDDRLAFIADLVGRDLGSSKNLTFDEGRGLIDAFEKAKGSADPQSETATIYLRTTGNLPASAPAVAAATVRDQTRAAVLGDPNGAGAGDEPPWDEPQQGELMPEPHTPAAYRRGEGE